MKIDPKKIALSLLAAGAVSPLLAQIKDKGGHGGPGSEDPGSSPILYVVIGAVVAIVVAVVVVRARGKK